MTIEQLKETINADIAYWESERSTIYKNHSTIEVIRDHHYQLLEIEHKIRTFKTVLRWCDTPTTRNEESKTIERPGA